MTKIRELDDAFYALSMELESLLARKHCANADTNAVHYFVEQSRKIQRMHHEINRRYPKKDVDSQVAY